MTIQSAFPLELDQEPGLQNSGFTKHELGAFMIAQGLVTKYNPKNPEDQDMIAKVSYQIAEAILYLFKK